jgi:hypothetical protein
MLTNRGSGITWACGAIFALYVGIVFITQLSLVVDPSFLHGQELTLFRYHQLADPGLFVDDYLTSFLRAFPQPYLYEWITGLWLSAGGELAVLHRLIPLVCWSAFVAGLGVVAWHLGGRIVALGVVGIAIAQPVFLHQITAATPHAFGFPLLAWGLVAFLKGSPRGLVLVTLLSSLLYTALAPMLGLMLAWQVLLTQRLWTRARAYQAQMLLLLAAVGALSLWLVYGSLGGPQGLGEALEPTQRADLYPENGPEGRHFYGVFNPLTYVLGKAVTQFNWSSDVRALLLLLVYGLFALYGLTASRKARSALAAFIVCGAAIWLAVLLFKPFHSYRFVLYPLFTLLPLLFVLGLQQFVLRYKGLLRLPEAVTLGLLTLFALTFDSLDADKLGYTLHLGPQHQEVIAFAAGQPPGTFIAVWPGADDELEAIPYVARRPLLVMHKAHEPSHEGHVMTMRARTYDLIEAYLATEPTALSRLHCRWGVDYLVVDKVHFGREEDRPEYFAPFDARIEEILQETPAEDFLLRAPDPDWVALETGRYFVLRLESIAPEDPGDGQAGCGPPSRQSD